MLFATLLYAFIWYSQTTTKRLSVNRPTSVPRPVSRVTVHKIVSQSLPTNKYLKLPLVLCLRRSGHLTAVRHSCSNASQNNLCNPAWWLCFRGIFLLFFLSDNSPWRNYPHSIALQGDLRSPLIFQEQLFLFVFQREVVSGKENYLISTLHMLVLSDLYIQSQKVLHVTNDFLF